MERHPYWPRPFESKTFLLILLFVLTCTWVSWGISTMQFRIISVLDSKISEERVQKWIVRCFSMTSQRLPVSDSSCWKIFLGIGWQHVFFRSHFFCKQTDFDTQHHISTSVFLFQRPSRISFEVSPQLCWLASMCAALSHQAWMRIAVKQHIIEGLEVAFGRPWKLFSALCLNFNLTVPMIHP